MAQPFDTQAIQDAREVTAPDGSAVRPLCHIDGLGSFARFSLGPGAVAHAVVHATVAEIWYVTNGAGRMWRRQDGREETVTLMPGTCVTIPVGTVFQFSADTSSDGDLQIVAVTMPPWPADGRTEATRTDGPWTPTVAAG